MDLENPLIGVIVFILVPIKLNSKFEKEKVCFECCIRRMFFEDANN